ncbi:MAG: SGNH/GDSL hydrolase family protein [Phycisphaerae bacterium]|nr:SGNH/GDSL hydrolase family protein [Phycisphaerae bacterium]
MTATRRIAFRIAAVLAGLILAVAAGEVIVRLAHIRPKQAKVHAPPTPDPDNPLGTRTPLGRLGPSGSRTRIVFIGDSFTYGLGVENDQTFAYRIGVLLEQARPGRYMTINLGRPGDDLIGEWTLYNRVRDLISPQVVVHVLSPNDMDVDLYRDFVPIKDLYVGRLWPSRYSRLLDFVEGTIRAAATYPPTLDYLRGGSSPQARRRAWVIVRHEIESMKGLVEAGGARYVLVRFPFLLELRDYPLENVHRRLAELAARLDIPYLDLLHVFRGQDGDAMVLPNDDHPNPRAHEIAAAAIAEFLINVVLDGVSATSRTAGPIRRDPAEIAESDVRHYREILNLDPTCLSARHWLNQTIPPKKEHAPQP